jgi:hypothetical protein
MFLRVKIISATCDRRYAMESADRVGFIVHKGKQVLVLDFTNCAPEEVKSVSDEARLIIAAQPQNSGASAGRFHGRT